MFKNLKIGQTFFKKNHNGVKTIYIENIYEDEKFFEINVTNSLSYAHGKNRRVELCLNKEKKEHLLCEIVIKRDAINDKYYILDEFDFDNEEDCIVNEFEQCNICGLTDDHAIDCSNG